MYLIFYTCFLFILYSFFGWVIEELYSLATCHKLQSDKFLNIPLKPMYGISMTILVIIYEVFQINTIYLIILNFIIPSTIEYLSAYLLKHLTNKTYWDYSSLKYNINGYVCLKFSLYWTILSYLGVIYINPVFKNYYLSNYYIINIFTLMLLFIFFGDFTLTLRKYS